MVRGIWLMKQQMIGSYLKTKYGRKIYKLSIDGGFSCPNRDELGRGGCLFCSARGSGDFTPEHSLTFAEQVARQKRQLAKKWQEITEISGERAFLIHFQNYSATYAPIERLQRLYGEALALDDVLGLVISTRPDLIAAEHADLFARFPIEWVELGLQSANDGTLSALNVGYCRSDFSAAVNKLKSWNIPVVAHIIYGLPGEADDDFFETVRYLSELGIFGVKIHMLNIVSDSALANQRTAQQWRDSMPSMEQYVSAVRKALDILPQEMVIHRLTGDGDQNKLIAPLWVKNKRKVLNSILKK